MRFATLAIVACAVFGATIADVSHLANHYIPPKMMMPSSTAGAPTMQPSDGRPPTIRMGERVVTTIEKQELRELPTQTEYLQPGQQPYGIGLVSSWRSNNQDGGMLAGGHNGELPLGMMMPRELLPPPLPLNQEQEPTNQYLAPMENTEATSLRKQTSAPMREYLAPPMMASGVPQPINLAATHPEMNAHDQQETREESDPPLKQYLAPKSILAQVHASREASASEPTNQYLAPPAMHSGEQQLQQQSEPAARYLPPQQQMPEMPGRQYLAPQIQSDEIQMQHQTSQASKMSPLTSEMSSPLMEVAPQMPQQSHEYLSTFGEAENVAEAAQVAAQEATAMLEAQSAHQPTPPALAKEPPTYYLPPQAPVVQQPNYQQQYHASQTHPQPEQLPPVKFVLRHHQLMTQVGSVDDAPVSFAQFYSMSSAAPPTVKTNTEPMPAHFINDDGYHYRNGGSSERLGNGIPDVRRFGVRH